MTQIIASKGGGGGVGLYKYKGSVQTYEDLPSSGNKIGDTYNVVQKHTTAPKFPAGSNLAWNGTEWDVLGGNFDLSDYQEKLVEGTGIDLDNDTNVISVDADIVSGAAAGATAVQPGDLATVATTGEYNDLLNKPTIGNAKLTIQKNGTDVNSITMNATSNVTANISVPTDTSDLTNGAGFVDKDVNNLTYYTLTSSLATVATSGSYADLSNKPTIGDATIKIQKNGTDIDSFTTNATSGKTINVTVPTKVTDLTDAGDYVKSSDLATVATTGAYSDLSGTPTLATVATSGSYNDLSNKPTIGTATLTIQKNGTNVQTFGANATSNVTANITVPTKVTDLSDASNYALKSSLATVATSGSYADLSNKPTIPGVVDNLTSTSTTDALSANQGKALKDMIDDLQALGKFLSLWDCSTGLPISFPQATPYTYSTGDYYLVETVDTTTNYRPNGSSYTGTASTTVETEEVEVGDLYIYDGTVWLLQLNHGKSVSFANLTGVPSDNTALDNALGAKQDVSNMVTTLTGADNTHYPTAKAVADAITSSGGGDMLKSVYDPNSVEADAFDYNNFINTPSLATVATSGAYSDLSGTPTLATVATSGSYTDLSDTPNLATVATSGSYTDLSNKPTIPTVNNATLTIQKNGTTVDTFTANASSNVTANITVPTKVSDLTNDSGFVTNQVSDTAYASSWDGDTTNAPSKNAVYDKIQSVVGSIPTVNNATLTIQKNGTTVNTFTANASSNVTANITVPTNVSDLTNDSGFITGITSSDVTTALGYTPQSALTTQTAYTTKGTATKVPTITTNTLGQVTAISETNISFPVTSVNGSTGAVTGLQSQHSTLTLTLASASWSSKSITVSATGVTASNTVIISPAPSSISDYSDGGVYCSSQSSNSLTFECDTEPTSDISVNVLILN